MFECAPYITNMCKSIDNHLYAEEDVSGDQSEHQKSTKKMESEVQISDVKGYEVNIFKPAVRNTTLCVVDDLIVSAKSDLYKAIKKIRPDSPDVIRAAKRFEQARLKGKCACEQTLETLEENSIDPESSEKPLGARKKNER